MIGKVNLNTFYNMAELVHGGKEHSDWFPERFRILLYGPLKWTAYKVI